MKKILPLCAAVLIGAAAAPGAMADPGRNESGHGRGHHGHYRGEHKQEYWDGHCKVERKWKGNGDYKEERKCRAPRYVQPVVVPGYPAYPPVEPGIVIQGTAVIR